MQVECQTCRVVSELLQYCDNCGASLDRHCSACNCINRPGARFCDSCGNSFAASTPAVDAVVPAQQKQLTVLFADICGSTEIVSSRDAEDASLILDAVLHVIEAAVRRYGGVVTHRLGDGVMVLFGAPAAAEDHAARACFAALAILADVAHLARRALPVRVGLCSGPVILRRTGRDEGDYDVAGVTVHIASRLEQRAEPGTILLAPQTLRLVAGIAETAPIGPIALKGLAEPLEVHRLVNARDRPSWVVRLDTRSLSPFVGRIEERAQLAAALRRATDRQTQAIVLVGDAGMGKSRLVHEFLAAVPSGEWHLFRVETTPLSMAVPYALLTATLRQIVGCSPEESLADIAAGLAPALTALGLDSTHDLSSLLSHLDQDSGATHAAELPAMHRDNLVRALAPILRRYAELHPIIFVIEDFHWLDASSVELLDAMRSELDGARLLLVLTTRPERRPSWNRNSEAKSRAAMLVIELAPLTEAQSKAMLSCLIGGADNYISLRDLIIARAGGTPFFLEEFAQSLREQGALESGMPRLSDIVIPASVQDILAARIDRLAPTQRRVLQIAAVIGPDVRQPILVAVADVPTATLANTFEILRAGRFLTRTTASGEIVYSFSHALTQAVAYGSLLRSDRRLVHERVLRALEAFSPKGTESDFDQLAHHAICAEAWPKAGRYAMAAGERASRRSAPTEAKAYFLSAIVALSRQPATPATIGQGIDARLGLRSIMSVSLADAADMQEMLQETLTEADHLAEQVGDRLTLARVYVGRAAILAHWGDLPTSIRLGRAALAIMRVSNEAAGTVAAAFTLVQALWYAGELAEAQEVLAATVGQANSPAGQQRSSSTHVLPAVGFWCYFSRIQAELGHHAESLTSIAEARNLAIRTGSLFDQILVDLNEGAAWLLKGETERAVELLERTLRITRDNMFEWHVSSIACLLGAGWVDMGRNIEARQLLEQASALADRNRHVAKRLLCSPPLIRALTGAPNFDFSNARRLADRTLLDAERLGFRPIVRQTHEALRQIKALST